MKIMKKREIEIGDFSDFSNVSYKTIFDIESLQHILKQIKDVGFFALDTETTSLNEREADLVGISIAFEVGKAFYIPVGHMENLEVEMRELYFLIQLWIKGNCQ